MILSYDPHKEEEDLNKSKVCDLSNLSSIQKGKIQNLKRFLDNSQYSTNSNRDLSNDNLIVFDVKYSEIFGKKNKTQNDDVFYEKFEDLKIIGNIDKKDQIKPEINYSHDDSEVSFKEENFFNAEFIKMINSTSMKEKYSRSNSLNVSGNGEKDISRSLKKNSTKTLLKIFKNEDNKKESCLDGNKLEKATNLINPKLEENKNSESANVSVLSDLSQGSRKNYIPKELIFGENSFDKPLTNEKNDNIDLIKKGNCNNRNNSNTANRDECFKSNLPANKHNPYSYFDMNIEKVESHFNYNDERIVQKSHNDFINLNIQKNNNAGVKFGDVKEFFPSDKKILNPIQNQQDSSSNMRQVVGNKEMGGIQTNRKNSINVNMHNKNMNINNYGQGGSMNYPENNIFNVIPKNIQSNNFTLNSNSRVERESIHNPHINMSTMNSIYVNNTVNMITPQNTNIKNLKNMNNHNFKKNITQISSANIPNNLTHHIQTNNSLNSMNLNNYQGDFGCLHNEFYSPTSEPTSTLNSNYYKSKNNNNMNNGNKPFIQQVYPKNQRNQVNPNRNSGQGNNYVNISISNNNINNTINNNNNNLNNIYGFDAGNINQDMNFIEKPIQFNQNKLPNKQNLQNLQNMHNIPNLNTSPPIFQNHLIHTNNFDSAKIFYNNQKSYQHTNFDDNFNLNNQPTYKEIYSHTPTQTPSNNPTHNPTPVSKNQKKVSKFQKLNLKFEDLTDDELAQLSLQIAKDQAGCRFLQKKIEQYPKYANDVLFPEIYNDLYEFMTDSFGNYLIQKIIENIDDNNLQLIINFIHPLFLELGLNQHGTRVIQKVIECVKKENQLDYFNKIFEPHLVELIKDVNGNHIIIKYVNTIKYPKNQFLYEVVAENTIELATNKHACCAFQKCLNNATESQRKLLIERIVENTYILISDAYGNYLLQFVLSMNDYETNHKIMTFFRNRMGYLSKQKFSSNVIEKCFDHCDKNTIEILVKELCNPKLITDLLLDMYGNYVLQKALCCSEEPCRSIFINTIGMNLEKLKTKNFGIKLLNKLIITYPEFNQFNSSMLMSGKNLKQSNPGMDSNNYNHNYIQENYPNTNNVRIMDYTNVNNNYELNMGGSGVNNVNYMNNGYLRNKNVPDHNPYSNFYS